MTLAQTPRPRPTAAYRLDLAEHEYKLIMRLRQLRNAKAVDAILVSLKPLTVTVVGEAEKLERVRVEGEH